MKLTIMLWRIRAKNSLSFITTYTPREYWSKIQRNDLNDAQSVNAYSIIYITHKEQ